MTKATTATTTGTTGTMDTATIADSENSQWLCNAAEAIEIRMGVFLVGDHVYLFMY